MSYSIVVSGFGSRFDGEYCAPASLAACVAEAKTFWPGLPDRMFGRVYVGKPSRDGLRVRTVREVPRPVGAAEWLDELPAEPKE